MALSKIIPKTGIKVSFFDNDGKKVSGVTVDQANQVAKQNPDKKFYFQNGDGVEQELGIDAVNQLLPINLLPSSLQNPTAPQICGPPLVRFFGGGGFGASANAIISPISSSIIGFDIVNPGFGFLENVSAELIDPCGKGSGSRLQVNLEEDDEDTTGEDTITGIGAGGDTTTLDECSIPRKNFENQIRRNLRRSKKIKNITIISPGNGYIASPDGSLGGNGRVWKEPDEGYVRSKCGGFYVVQPYRPIPVKVGDTYYPPDGPPILIEEDEIITLPLVPVTPPIPETVGITYPVILVIDEVVVLDPGFGYRPGDEIIITSADTGGAGGGADATGGAGGGADATGGAGGGADATGGAGNGKSNLGAELEMIINDRGQIEKVNVIKPGAGFIDLPRLRTNSPTGFNATFSTILKPIRLEDFDKDLLNRINNSQIISVIDCVGKILPRPQFDIVPR